MKAIKYTLALMVVFFPLGETSIAQVKTRIYPDQVPSRFKTEQKESKKLRLIPPEEFYVKRQRGDERENQFAVSGPVSIDIMQSKKIRSTRNLHNVKNEYCLTITAEDALNLSVEFSEFELMKGDILTIFTDKELTDSITSDENNINNIWATRVYRGKALTFLLTSAADASTSKLVIGKVNFGYRLFALDIGSSANTVANCHVNANCPAGDGWNNEKNSVAMILITGTQNCTGTLIMNTCNLNIPYILTADHCLPYAELQNWVFQFKKWSANCDGTGVGEDLQFNGCTLVARDYSTDFALVKLNQTPAANSGLHYAGWSRLTDNITSTTILHHPDRAPMKISRDNEPPLPVTWEQRACWQLGLDLGITESGSSGAAYFNQNHQIIGQHRGRPQAISGLMDACDITDNRGGRFDLSWDGDSSNSRLRDWLDPNNSDAFTTNTTNISLLQSVTPAITGGVNLICSGSSTYSVTGLPAGTTVTWTISNPFTASIQPNGQSVTVNKVGNGLVTLIATLQGCLSRTLSREIMIGTPNDNIIFSVTGPSTFCPGQMVQYFATSNSTFLNQNNLIRYSWQWPSGWTVYAGGPGYNYINLIPNSSPGSVVVRASTDCGMRTNGPIYARTLSQACGGFSNGYSNAVIPYEKVVTPGMEEKSFLNVYPNRVSSAEIVVISQISEKNIETGATLMNIREVKIMNIYGSILLSKKFSNNNVQARLNVSALKNGTYMISIYNGKVWQTQRLIIAAD